MIVKYKEVKMDSFFRRKIVSVECECLFPNKEFTEKDGLIIEYENKTLFSLEDGITISKCPFCGKTVSIKKTISLDVTPILIALRKLKAINEKKNPTKLKPSELMEYLVDTSRIAAYEREIYERIEEFLQEE